MIHAFTRVGVLALMLGSGLLAGEARAAFSGSFGFNGLGTATDTGNLAAATKFTNLYFTTNGNATGGFSPIANLPILSPAAFSPTTGLTITLTTDTPTGFSFTSPTYGTFTQTTVADRKTRSFSDTIPSFVTSVTYYVVGSYTGGAVGAATPASVTITFTQNGGPGSSFSASGTLDIQPMSVPEPASLAMLGLGLVGVAIVRRRSTS